MFAGIDVAFAKGKRLPVCFVSRRRGRLEPLAVDPALVPRGLGNPATIHDAGVTTFAEDVLALCRHMEQLAGEPITVVALDAPSDPSPGGRRACERAMDMLGISCFPTPTYAQLEDIRARVSAHLAAGRPVNRLPHANQLWMFVGFALFQALRPWYTCLEVFPNAIAHRLGTAGTHKFKAAGRAAQLAAIAHQTGWTPDGLETRLRETGFGAMHDRVDAFMCAWVASRYPDGVDACGDGERDTIWIPRVSTD